MQIISERLVLQKLKEYLMKKGYSFNMLQEDYKLQIGTKYIRFDLVVLDQDEPVEIYEVRSKYADIPSYTNNYRKLKAKKGLLSKIPAFIASVKGNGQLYLQSMQDKIYSFQDFYLTFTLYTEAHSNEFIYFYRGHNDTSYSFYPSIYRDDNKTKGISNEDTMFNDAIRYCPNDFTNSMTSFEKLVKMQHYELPTRLLDITTNPLVALYFACNSKYTKDGEVVIFKVRKDTIKYFNSDIVSIISNIAKRPKDFKIDTTLTKEAFNQQTAVQYLLHDIKQEKPYFQHIINPDDLNKVVCVLPKLDNPRIVRQSGAFFLFGINKHKTIPANFEYAPKRIIIDHGVKLKILQELKNIGIDHATLFPEIDNIMKKIKEQND